MAGQFLANGGSLGIETTPGSGSYNEIGNIISYDLGNFVNARVDVSNLDSPNNAKEYLQGQQDVPEATFELHLNPGSTQHQGLWTDSGAGAGSAKKYRLKLGTGDYPNFAGDAFVSGFQVSGGVDGPVVMNLAIQWSQRPTAEWAAP